MPDDSLSREIRQLRGDLRDDLTEIKASIAGLLPREVYAAHHEALKHRVAVVEAEVKTLETIHVADVERLQRALADAEEKRQGARRWLIGSAVLPIVALAVTVGLFFMK